jgi:hypothetical protein
MTKLGKRLIKAADEALAIARGEVSARQLNLFKGKRQRGQRVDVSPSEFQLQCEVADLLRRCAKPTWLWTHLPFGEARPAEFRNGVRVSYAGERLKRMGVRPGWPDFALLGPKDDAPHPGIHFLELKRKGGRLSEHQAGFALWCEINRIPHAVVDTVEAAIFVLDCWDVWRLKPEVQ